MPSALIAPSTRVGSTALATRLTTVHPGCAVPFCFCEKTSVVLAPTLKLCQLSRALDCVWLIVTVTAPLLAVVCTGAVAPSQVARPVLSLTDSVEAGAALGVVSAGLILVTASTGAIGFSPRAEIPSVIVLTDWAEARAADCACWI